MFQNDIVTMALLLIFLNASNVRPFESIDPEFVIVSLLQNSILVKRDKEIRLYSSLNMKGNFNCISVFDILNSPPDKLNSRFHLFCTGFTLISLQKLNAVISCIVWVASLKLNHSLIA